MGKRVRKIATVDTRLHQQFILCRIKLNFKSDIQNLYRRRNRRVSSKRYSSNRVRISHRRYHFYVGSAERTAQTDHVS